MPYLSALEVCSWQGAIQIHHVYLYLTLPYLIPSESRALKEPNEHEAKTDCNRNDADTWLIGQLDWQAAAAAFPTPLTAFSHVSQPHHRSLQALCLLLKSEPVDSSWSWHLHRAVHDVATLATQSWQACMAVDCQVILIRQLPFLETTQSAETHTV